MSASVAAAQALVDAINAGEDDGAVDRLYAPDAEHVVAAQHPEARTCRGREEIAAYLREWDFEEPRYAVSAIMDAGERALVLGRLAATLRGTGLPLDVALALLVTARDGQITRVEEYLDPAEARAAAGFA